MKKLKEIFNVKFITSAILIYIMLQPAFDILSFLDIRGLIPFGISTYVKPIFVFGMAFVIYLLSKKQRKKWTLMFVAYAIFIAVHSFILYKLKTETGLILQEIRFLINIAYMLVLYMIFDFLYRENDNKEKFIKDLKNSLVITFIMYSITIIVAMITGTSGNTYEYSDPSKLGYKGWLDSGQIFGHALSIVLPGMIFYLFNKEKDKMYKNIILRILTILPVIVLYMIGTKVTYFICAAALGSHVVLDFIYWLKEKENKKLLIGSISSLFLVAIFLGTYKYSPVYFNTQINNAVLAEEISAQLIAKDSSNREELKKMQEYMKNVESGKVKLDLIADYYNADIKATQVLQNKYAEAKIHPNDNRSKQLVYTLNKYNFAGTVFKLFGLGYLNQPTGLSIERDILMVTFSLGLIGVLTILVYPVKSFIGSTVYILRRLKKVKLETLYLYEGFGIFFCISFYAGYTFIYTNFSIFLVTIIFLLKASIDKEKQEEREDKHIEEKEKVLGFDVCNEEKEVIIKKILKDFDNNEKTFIVNINPEISTENFKNEDTVKKFNKQKYQIPDGIGIVIASKIKNGNIKNRITGIDLMKELCAKSVEHNGKIFLYGAKPGVAETAKKELENEYKGIKIVGTCDGYGKQEEATKKIKEAGANILFVALGSPRQEEYILDNMENELKDVKLFMPVGGSLDVISKTIKRAPKWVQKANLEWLYRLCKEPKRFFRQLNLVKFLFLVVFKDKEKVGN